MSLVCPPWIPELLKAGIHVTVMEINGRVLFDMNLKAKSHMHLYLSPTGWRAAMRYNEDHPVRSMDDLLDLAVHGMHGRDFVSGDWEVLINKKAATT